MDINSHPIHKAIYELCLEIEKLPASEQQTKVVTMASALHEPVAKVVTALKDAVSVYQDWPAVIAVTEERVEAWQSALK